MNASDYVPHYAAPDMLEIPRFDLSFVFDQTDPEIHLQNISISLALTARQKAETLVDLRRHITRMFLISMDEYRDYRLEELFLEEKSLEEQLTILRQRLKEHGDGPPLEIRMEPAP